MGCNTSSQALVPVSTTMDAQPFRVICISGPPAVGKGTICSAIKDRYGLVHISIGEILHNEVHRGTSFGEKVRPYMEGGQLVPCDLVVDLLYERLCCPDALKRGCMIDNFPITVDQALSLKKKVTVDKFMYVDVPDDILIERAKKRRLDPITGHIYNTESKPPPPEVSSRLIKRKDDAEHLVHTRLDTYRKHIGPVLPHFEVHQVNGNATFEEVTRSVFESLDQLEWTTEEKPYFGNIAFSGPFSAVDAKRAGFYSPLEPPDAGSRISCFQRGDDLLKRGVVTDLDTRISMGTCTGIGGLKKGEEGVKVEASLDDGKHISSWSAFLAPENEMEYSSICTTSEFEQSTFARLNSSCAKGIFDTDPVAKDVARVSLENWLQNLEDADGEEVEMLDGAVAEILQKFDDNVDASLYLYSTHVKLSKRLSSNTGLDYSLYYRAVNNTLNSDSESNLARAMPLLQRMTYLLLYDDAGNKRYHKGGRVYKGDVQRPVPLNRHKLHQAREFGYVIRFRQFQSTTVDEALADKYKSREDGRGYKWTIDIPKDFWGARAIEDIAWKAHESETLFPPYAAFRVVDISEDCCHLLAVDRSDGVGKRARRNGLKGTPIELLCF